MRGAVPLRLLQAAIVLLFCTAPVTATCYAPDGTVVTTSDVAPCSSDPSDPLSHVCCNLNRPKAPGTSTNASEIRDTCLPNGLCQNESLLKDGSTYMQWGRNFCTNRDWSTGQCLDACTTNDRTGSKRLVPCSGKNSSITWCCGDSDACCTSTGEAEFVSLSPTFTIAAISSSSSVSSSASSTALVTSLSATSSPTSAEPSSTSATAPPTTSDTAKPSAERVDTGLSRGAKAGISIGAVVGAVLLVILGVWISKVLAWRRDAYAARAQNNPGYYTPNSPGSDVEGLYGQHPQKYAFYAEVDATTPPVEAVNTPDPVEAPNTEVGARNSRFGGFSLGRG